MHIKLIAVRELYQIILDPKEECLLKLALLNKPNFGKNEEKGKSFVYDLMLLLDCNFGESWKHGYGVDRDELELLRFILVYQNNLDLYGSMIEELEKFLFEKREKKEIIPKQILSKAVETYGYIQIIKTIEELAELQKELSKQYIYHKLPDLVDNDKFKTNIGNIIEELADVEIMLEQVKMILSITQESIDGIKKQKLEKLEVKKMKITEELKELFKFVYYGDEEIEQEELDAILSSPEYLEFVKQEEAYQQLVDDSMKN